MPPIIAICIWPSARLYQSLLLIICLILLAPLRRLILAALLLCVALLFRLMHRLAVVLRRTVHRHNLQRLRLGRVVELMLRPCWYDDDVGGFDVL